MFLSENGPSEIEDNMNFFALEREKKTLLLLEVDATLVNELLLAVKNGLNIQVLHRSIECQKKT